MIENKNQPAFPDTMRAQPQSYINQNPEQWPTGLTKREIFAMAAMQGLMAVNKKGEFDTAEDCLAEAARLSVIAADKLLAELSKS